MRDRSTETTVQTTTEKGILNTHKQKHKHKQPLIGPSDDNAATSIGKSGASKHSTSTVKTSIGKSNDTAGPSRGKPTATSIGTSLVQETSEYREREYHNPEPTGASNNSTSIGMSLMQETSEYREREYHNPELRQPLTLL